jgi:hypothetical protein
MALSATVRRSVQETVPGGVPSAAEDGTVFKGFPTLQGFLRETAWDDGATRETATLMIFAEDGRWKVMMNDREALQVCFVSGNTVGDCLRSLEKGLLAGNLDWRRSKTQASSRKRS